jgi:hypothetical protein
LNTPVDATTIVQEQQYSGVLVESLRMMLVVADSPMAVDHTYPSKEVSLIRISEEANYSGCAVSIGRSDTMRVHAYGRNGSNFEVKVVCSDTFGWRVAQCDTCLPAAMICDVAAAEEAQAGVVTECGTLHDDDSVVGDIGAADIDSDQDHNTPNKDTMSACTPFKSRWLVPLIQDAISEMPNMANK